MQYFSVVFEANLVWCADDIEVSIEVSILVLSISVSLVFFVCLQVRLVPQFLSHRPPVALLLSAFYYYDFLAFSAAIDLSFWDTSLQTTAFNLQANDDMNRLLNEPEVF